MAHKGITKPATPSLTPSFFACASVTGIVAADDCVPSAVKYAGSIVPSSLSGFLLLIEKNDATVNCKSKTPICIAKIIRIIVIKVFNTGPT